MLQVTPSSPQSILTSNICSLQLLNLILRRQQLLLFLKRDSLLQPHCLLTAAMAVVAVAVVMVVLLPLLLLFVAVSRFLTVEVLEEERSCVVRLGCHRLLISSRPAVYL